MVPDPDGNWIEFSQRASIVGTLNGQDRNLIFDTDFDASVFDGFLSSPHEAAIANTTGSQEGAAFLQAPLPADPPSWRVRVHKRDRSMTYRHVAAPTQFVEANGIRFAYRRFGQEGGTPLLFMQHFRGGMDHWDPAVTDGFAEGRPVILFDNAGVASSSAETPDTIDAMAEHAADFVGALGLSQVDLLGFSIGGYIAQTLTIRHPELIRRLILVGTGPRAGEPPQDPKYAEYGGLTDPKTGQAPLETFLYLFFRPSDTSQSAGKAFWARRHARKEDVDVSTSAQTMAAQRAAITEWRQTRGERFAEFKAFTQPTLVVNGHSDIMVPTINSFTLSQNIPNAQLIVFPDSGHGSLFQFPELFVTQGRLFLDGPFAATGR
jgi:pimeloyl-ACP methyl ester carboxylesterase